MSAAPLFEVRAASFRYGNVEALRDLSLTVQAGERVALLGANGSGKSTLLKLLDALYFPCAGEVRFQGELLTEAHFEEEAFAHAFRRKVAFVFQNPDVQLFCPTVEEEVAFGPLQMRWPKQTVRAKVEGALTKLGIAHLRDRAPHHLSGGEKKKVALASVLVLEPEVILLDEPTASLDPRSQTQIIDLLAGWNGGETVITATHDLHTLEDIAGRCVIFEAGRIAASGAPAEILGDRALLERANLIHAHRGHGHVGGGHSHAHLGDGGPAHRHE